MMKLDTLISYLRKIQKTYKSCDTPVKSAEINIFSTEFSNFCYINKSFNSLKVFLINMVTDLMMLVKIAYLGLLEI